MALPEQIRKQTEAVQELYKQINNEEDTGENTADESAAFVNTEYNEEGGTSDESGSSSASQPPADEHKAGGKKESEETLTQKYRTLQGMYNAEVPRLHQQNKELQGRIQQMEQLLATLTAGPASAPAAPQQMSRLVTEEDVEAYGESLDVMRKVSREEYMPVAQKIAMLERELQRMQTQVVPQVNTLAQRQAQSAEQQFWAQLSGAVPNWQDINNNPDFQTWLLQVDPLIGISRQTLLDDAQRNFDVGRIATFFHTWSEISGYASDAQNTRRNETASQLEKQVAPGKSRSTGVAAGPSSKTYTPEDIRMFFDAVRQGKYKGREAERDRIERDIFAAQRENRIIANA